MPIGGARTLEDLQSEGRERLVVVCGKCDRRGDYAVARMIEEHGAGERLPDLLAYLSRNCPKRGVGAMLDQCGARYDFGVG
jgi:hypothetical protein